MSILMKLIYLSFKLTLFTGLICFSIVLLPDKFFGDIKFDPQAVPNLEVDLPANLQTVEVTPDQLIKLDLERVINEPESLKFHNNFIYTGVSNGQILKIDEKNRKVTVLTNLVDKEAKNCENVQSAQERCGRALDIEIVGNRLYAVDTYHGFIEYDLVKNTKTTYDLSNKIPGYETNHKIFNSIREDPTNPNIVYISLSSTKYPFDKIYFTFLEHETSGILISFNKQTKKVTVIGSHFTLSNGLEIMADKKSLLLNDLCNSRIFKFDLKEVNTYIQKGGQSVMPKKTIFKDKLPGYPDNLTKHGKHLFVALFQFIPNDDIFLRQIVLPNLYLRKFIYRFFYLTSEFLKMLNKYYTCDCLTKLQQSFETGKVMMPTIRHNSAIAVIDQTTENYVTLIKLPINAITHAIYNPTTSSLYLGSIVHKSIHKMNFKL